nr:MAG TPA: hypothetical protein [Caudoviricetes sp.]
MISRSQRAVRVPRTLVFLRQDYSKQKRTSQYLSLK